MAFGTVPLVATSDSWTASQHNTYLRDNMAAIWVGTTAGDTDYYTSATAKSRLAIGTANQIMRSTGSAPAWADLSTITAAKALVASQATSDMFYATSSTVTARLALGSAHTFLKSNGSAPNYGTISWRRQGGSATAWGTAGTTSYTPTYELIQKGSKAITVTTGNGSATVTFPVSYSYVPHVTFGISTADGSQRMSSPLITAISTTAFTVEIWQIDSGSVNIVLYWTASGE